MRAIVQTGFYGIDSIKEYNFERNKITPTAIEITTTIVPLIRYDLLKLKGEIETTIPSVMGYGAVGKVSKVGFLRSNNLLGKKVLVLNPKGTFQERILSNLPPLVIPVPKGVKDEEAVTLIGGGDIALTLLKLLRQSSPKQVIIYGANSVTGLILMQLLTKLTKLSFVPITTKASQKYLNDKIFEYGIRSSEYMEKIPSTVIDMAGHGITKKLMEHVRRGDKVYSIAQNNLRGVQFISRPSFPNDYQTLLKMIANKQLFIPIGEIFSIDNIKSAMNYLNSHHSRGRILLSFEK